MIVQHPISKQWATSAIVTEVGPNRDYIVKTPAGRLFRRNRRMLRKRIPAMPGKSTPGILFNHPLLNHLRRKKIQPRQPVEHEAKGKQHQRYTKTIDTQDKTTRTFP